MAWAGAAHGVGRPDHAARVELAEAGDLGAHVLAIEALLGRPDQESVVRVVGGYTEGTGFFVEENKILTNFHVIEGEPSPKIIFPDGSFETVTNIVGDPMADLAILTIKPRYPKKVLSLMMPVELLEEEPLISVGYPLGTDLPGAVTIQKGNFIAYRTKCIVTVVSITHCRTVPIAVCDFHQSGLDVMLAESSDHAGVFATFQTFCYQQCISSIKHGIVSAVDCANKVVIV